MGYLKIHCHNCENDFPIYAHEIERRPRIYCPHCYAMMNDSEWTRAQSVFFDMEEINKGLQKAHEKDGKPLMQIEYESKYVKPDLYCLAEGVREWV